MKKHNTWWDDWIYYNLNVRLKEIKGDILQLEKQLKTKEKIYEFLLKDFHSGKYLKNKIYTMQQMWHLRQNIKVLSFEIDRKKDIIEVLTWKDYDTYFIK